MIYIIIMFVASFIFVTYCLCDIAKRSDQEMLRILECEKSNKKSI